MRYFAGIDPGQTGGIGILNEQGKFVTAHRWDKRDPKRLYETLYYIKDIVLRVYIENVNLPQTGAGLENKFCGSGNLLVNVGIWQGFLIALDIPFDEIAPATWQAAFGLFQWKKKLEKAAWQESAAVQSPLTLARKLWPGAPLEFQADDGKAVGLFLAGLARQDHHNGIDRGEVRARAQAKVKRKKKEKRALRKLADAPPW